MGAYVIPRISAQRQYALLKLRNPHGNGCIHRGCLTWRWTVQPTPISRAYKARLICDSKGYPTVFIDDPNLRVLANGRHIPHLYDQEKIRLCLYLPGAAEWTTKHTLADTLVPWTSLWLLFFEEWLWSDEWKGGGVHPPGPKIEKK